MSRRLREQRALRKLERGLLVEMCQGLHARICCDMLFLQLELSLPSSFFRPGSCANASKLRFVASHDGARPLALYGVCAAVSVAIAFLVNVSPAHWTVAACDAIAINSATAVIIATAAWR
jgi:hypothetical protein